VPVLGTLLVLALLGTPPHAVLGQFAAPL